MLPHAKSIRNWTSSLDGKPGFLQEVLNSLQTLDANDKHCTLAFMPCLSENRSFEMIKIISFLDIVTSEII